MLIHTAEGKRSIDDDLVVCIDRHRGETERCIVTLYLLSGGTGHRRARDHAPRRMTRRRSLREAGAPSGIVGRSGTAKLVTH